MPRTKSLVQYTRGARVAQLLIGLSTALLCFSLYTGYNQLAASKERNLAVDTQLGEARLELAQVQSLNARLQDPRFLNLEARRQLGMVNPGEEAYALAIPDLTDREVLAAPEPEATPTPQSWWDRLKALAPFNS